MFQKFINFKNDDISNNLDSFDIFFELKWMNLKSFKKSFLNLFSLDKSKNDVRKPKSLVLQ